MKIFKLFKKRPLLAVIKVINMLILGAIIAALFTGVLFYFYMALAAIAMQQGVYINIPADRFILVYGLSTGWFTIWAANRRVK